MSCKSEYRNIPKMATLEPKVMPTMTKTVQRVREIERGEDLRSELPEEEEEEEEETFESAFGPSLARNPS